MMLWKIYKWECVRVLAPMLIWWSTCLHWFHHYQIYLPVHLIGLVPKLVGLGHPLSCRSLLTYIWQQRYGLKITAGVDHFNRLLAYHSSQYASFLQEMHILCNAISYKYSLPFRYASVIASMKQNAYSPLFHLIQYDPTPAFDVTS